MTDSTPYHQKVNPADVENHVARVRGQLQAFDSERRREVEEQFPGAFERVESTLDYVLVVVARADLSVVARTTQLGLDAHLDGLRLDLEKIVTGAQPASHFSEADEEVEQVLVNLAQWSPRPDDGVSAAAKEAAATYRRSAGQQFSTLEAKVGEAVGRLAELDSKIDGLEAALVEDRQNMVAALEEGRTTVAEQKGRLDNALGSYQQQFSEAQDRNSARFDEQVRELENRIAEVQTSASQELQETRSEAKRQADELISELEGRRDEAGQLMEVISVTGTASAFGKEATQQKKAADRWRLGAVAFGVVAAALAVWAILHAQVGGDSAADLISKGLGTIVFGGIAGYAAKQSSDHRNREKSAKRRELELTAFGPFINELDADRQQNTREKVADRMFGQPDAPPSSDDGALTESSVSLVRQIFDAARGSGT